ncbi:MAG: type II toxin-antitoxin system prevent-host-death family antitoxin [Armatimonadota bacterium]|nr:type II toxin-antitoxin system prevent-host-death family antitoxin [Armatimonadota bacterium]
MVTISSKEAKEKFGALVDTARREPVTITKHSRPVVVVVSSERYAELEALEDEVWAARAREAEKRGYLSTEESEAVIQGILNAEA